MSTVFDLAERHGVGVDHVRRWLKGKGLLRRGEDRVSAAAEEQFRRAHGGQVMLEVAFAAPPPGPSPAPEGREARAPGLPEVLQSERFYKKQHAALHAAYLAAKAEASAAVAERDRLAARVAALEARPAARPAPPPRAQPSLGEALAARGVRAGDEGLALLHLLADDARAAALLAALQLSDPAALEALRRICAAEDCQRFAGAAGWLGLGAPSPADCAVCEGRGNQGAWRRMAQRLIEARRSRLLVVGGSEASHADLNTLNGIGPSLRLTLVDGTVKGTGQQARSRCRGADVVVIWGSTRLDHAVSDLYRDEARGLERVLLVSVAKRGVQSLVAAVQAALG